MSRRARSQGCGPKEVQAHAVARRPYEVMIILDADLEEETIRAAVERWLQLIEAHGAERGHVDWWGKRRLAYEINRKTDGYYVVFQAQGRAGGDGRVAPDALPCRRSHPSQGAADPREGLRTSEGGRRRRGGPLLGRITWPTTPTRSPSSATSPATPRCATPRAASRPRPSASPSTVRGATSRRTSGRSAPASSTSCAGAASPRTSAASLKKGTRVVVTGRLEQRSWETEQGEKRSVVEIVADDVAPSLLFATAEVHRIERSGPGEGGGGGGAAARSPQQSGGGGGGDRELRRVRRRAVLSS